MAFVPAMNFDYAEVTQAEETLRRQAEMLRLSFDAIIVWRLGAAIESWNRGAEELYGFSETEAVGHVTHDLLQTVFPAPWAEIEAQLREAGRWEGELRHRAKDGCEVVVSARKQLIPGPDGAARVMETNRDVTERKRAEEALRESERHFRLVVESLPQLVWTCAADGRCDFLSPQWIRYTGKSEAEQLAYGWLEQVHPDDRARVAEQWRATSARGENFETEYRVRRHDGAFRWFRALAVPLHDEAGGVVKWFGSNTDIDDIKDAEQALRENDRRKDEFLAMLGHELRNPIASISNCVRTLQSGFEGAKAAEMRDIMVRQVDHLVRLVDDLLEVSRVSQGRIALRKERIDLAQVVKDAAAASQPLIADFRHRLTVSLPSAPMPLEADPTRLAQVLINLLNNAAKFTAPGGRIDVLARAEDGEAIVSVRDNGVGIPADELARIFDLFAQFDRGFDHSRHGLGIGLALARSLAEMHGGRVEARSDGVGRGSEFVVRLPLASSVTEAPVEAAITQGTKAATRRVLVVDDNRDVADSFVMLLETLGADVRVAYGGRTALEIAAAFKPEMVFLDLSMPDMDGYQTAKRLRQLPDRRGVQLFALTGWGQEKDRLRAQEAGFDKRLTKPVDFGLLERILAGRR